MSQFLNTKAKTAQEADQIQKQGEVLMAQNTQGVVGCFRQITLLPNTMSKPKAIRKLLELYSSMTYTCQSTFREDLSKYNYQKKANLSFDFITHMKRIAQYIHQADIWQQTAFSKEGPIKYFTPSRITKIFQDFKTFNQMDPVIFEAKKKALQLTPFENQMLTKGQEVVEQGAAQFLHDALENVMEKLPPEIHQHMAVCKVVTIAIQTQIVIYMLGYKFIHDEAFLKNKNGAFDFIKLSKGFEMTVEQAVAQNTKKPPSMVNYANGFSVINMKTIVHKITRSTLNSVQKSLLKGFVKNSIQKFTKMQGTTKTEDANPHTRKIVEVCLTLSQKAKYHSQHDEPLLQKLGTIHKDLLNSDQNIFMDKPPMAAKNDNGLDELITDGIATTKKIKQRIRQFAPLIWSSQRIKKLCQFIDKIIFNPQPLTDEFKHLIHQIINSPLKSKATITQKIQELHTFAEHWSPIQVETIKTNKANLYKIKLKK